MNIDKISFHLCLLQFLSLKSCSFRCTDLPGPWLNLFLHILLFLMLLYKINTITVQKVVFYCLWYIALYALDEKELKNFFSCISLLVYWNAVDFCAPVLYPANLLSSLILVFFDGVFRILYREGHSICKQTVTASFLIWMLFIV